MNEPTLVSSVYLGAVAVLVINHIAVIYDALRCLVLATSFYYNLFAKLRFFKHQHNVTLAYNIAPLERDHRATFYGPLQFSTLRHLFNHFY